MIGELFVVIALMFASDRRGGQYTILWLFCCIISNDYARPEPVEGCAPTPAPRTRQDLLGQLYRASFDRLRMNEGVMKQYVKMRREWAKASGTCNSRYGGHGDRGGSPRALWQWTIKQIGSIGSGDAFSAGSSCHVVGPVAGRCRDCGVAGGSGRPGRACCGRTGPGGTGLPGARPCGACPFAHRSCLAPGPGR